MYPPASKARRYKFHPIRSLPPIHNFKAAEIVGLHKKEYAHKSQGGGGGGMQLCTLPHKMHIYLIIIYN